MEYAHAESAAIKQHAYADRTDTPAQPTTAEIGARLSNLRDELQSTVQDLSMLRERLYGAEPAPGTGRGPDAIPKPSGVAGEIMQQLDGVRDLANHCSALARGLNGRI